MAESHHHPGFSFHSNHNRFSPNSNFRPSLRFARGLFDSPNFFSSYYSKPKSYFPFFKFRSQISNPRDHRCFQCFRCGFYGHVARDCKITVRCFRCCGFGHMSRRCSKKMSPSTQDSSRDFKAWDDSWFLQDSYSEHPPPREDFLLLDPDVVRCSVICGKASDMQRSPCPPDSSIDFIYGAFNGARLDSSQVPSEKLPILIEEPTTEITPSVAISIKIQRQTYLDLNPVPRDLFEDFVIIDDFEDVYSDEEDLSPRSISVSIVEGSFGNMDVSRKDGNQVFMPMDVQKFIMYCRIQAVDGFNRLIRARARGSVRGLMRMSPFRSKDEIKKSCYIECLRESCNPPRMVAPVSPPIPVAVKKKKVDIKPFRGLIIPGSVRRSPRLNKGLFGPSM